MVERTKALWHEWIPGWFPIASAILAASFWLGQQQQRIIDRLDSQDKQIQAIQQYLRENHGKQNYPEASIPGITMNRNSSQYASE
jgi:hypothetical protein